MKNYFEKHYVYDSMNRRLKSTEIDDGTTKTRHFVYDGMNCIAELKVESEKLKVEKTFVRGAGLGGGIGDIISIINCQLSIINYLHYNHRGDVILTTDEAGNEKSKYSYTAFGKLTANSLPLTANCFIGFSSKEYDKKTGLIYFGFRYYDPELGRWLKFDPAKEDGNFYVFVANNPVSGVDILGLKRAVIVVGGIAYWRHVFPFSHAAQKVANTSHLVQSLANHKKFKKAGWDAELLIVPTYKELFTSLRKSDTSVFIFYGHSNSKTFMISNSDWKLDAERYFYSSLPNGRFELLAMESCYSKAIDWYTEKLTSDGKFIGHKGVFFNTSYESSDAVDNLLNSNNCK